MPKLRTRDVTAAWILAVAGCVYAVQALAVGIFTPPPPPPRTSRKDRP